MTSKLTLVGSTLLAGILLIPAVITPVTTAKAATNIRTTQVKTPTSADINTTSGLTQKQAAAIDPYVTVKNNQYVLNLPADNKFSKTEINEAQILIDHSNQVITQTNAVINMTTKVASLYPIQAFSYGKNDIQIHWNYARIYLNKSQTKALVSAAIGGGSTALGGFLGSVGGAAAGAAIGAYIASIAGDNIKNGCWVDFNYFTKTVNKFGWQ